ncbi:hypothetical protein DL96DRAFT_1705164 [Flagelloscypha sp. PMI_526]|nr:hypothetical protein DL96DRAFT_1705164 [Flagelloscypha sp. PMI_526]
MPLFLPTPSQQAGFETPSLPKARMAASWWYTGDGLGTIPGGILGGPFGEPPSGVAKHSIAKGLSTSFDDLDMIIGRPEGTSSPCFAQEVPSLDATNTRRSHLPFRLLLKRQIHRLVTLLGRLLLRDLLQRMKMHSSPNKPMPPSATCITCLYVRRDGKVTLDVQTLAGVSAIQCHNAITYALTQDEDYAKQAVRFFRAFFVDSKTCMSLNVDLGQVVRRPGPKGLVFTIFVVSSRSWVVLLSRRWQIPPFGPIQSIRRCIWGNNHVTFYVAQVAAARYYSGFGQGAAAVWQDFFDNTFQDQIVKTSEQPFEGTRTCPQLYRAFNLKALTTKATLGD